MNILFYTINSNDYETFFLEDVDNLEEFQLSIFNKTDYTHSLFLLDNELVWCEKFLEDKNQFNYTHAKLNWHPFQNLL